jgi:tetratricopeptide (TPR) repeat protein
VFVRFGLGTARDGSRQSAATIEDVLRSVAPLVTGVAAFGAGTGGGGLSLSWSWHAGAVQESWDQRIARFWELADDDRPDAVLAGMEAIVSERPEGDPEALYEWASVHDFLGFEPDAIPLYRQALQAGLDGARRSQAIIQLASSLRNVGDAAAAVGLLDGIRDDPTTGDAAGAFLALALHDLGRYDDALRVALDALARTLPLYGKAVERYAEHLGATDNAA